MSIATTVSSATLAVSRAVKSCKFIKATPSRSGSVFRSRQILEQQSLFSSTTRPLSANVCKLEDPKSQLLDHVDVFIFDCDGVIWRGNSLIEGVPQTLEKLYAAGKEIFFLTNNATKSRLGNKKKFDSLGLDFVPAESIFSSSFAAAVYLKQLGFLKSGKKAYVIGEEGICEELELMGIPHIGGPAHKDKLPNLGPGGTLPVDPDVGAVVVGLDRQINYYKIQYAQLCINELGAKFIATNLDTVGNFTDAQKWAGSGSMVGAIKGCTGQEPVVVGKPNPLMIEHLEREYGVADRKRICMVGDRLDTDIRFGTDNGLRSLLVLSGVTTEAFLLNPDNTIRPDYYATGINQLVNTD